MLLIPPKGISGWENCLKQYSLTQALVVLVDMHQFMAVEDSYFFAAHLLQYWFSSIPFRHPLNVSETGLYHVARMH